MSDDSDSIIPFDINKIYSGLAEKIITGTATSVYSKGKSFLKSVSNDIRLNLQRTYEDYLASAYENNSKAKSFLIRDEATQLNDFYVPMGIVCGTRKIEKASIFNFSEKNGFAVIEGVAGSGKSMMMRYLFLNTIEKQERVGIFIELRRLNDFEGSLLAFVKKTLREYRFTLDDNYIEKALTEGHFAIFLDGFDELSGNKRKQITKEIKDLSQNFEKNIIIVSSRPDTEYSSWESFDVWKISPLTLNQALNLIKKVPAKNIDRETKDKFLRDLKGSLFEKHKSFLSNPLLLSIMVITYANSGDVPEKLSIFYENAYIALFERHDALKGAFKREKRCNLDILEFKRVFSAFAVLTSNNQLYNSKKNSLRFSKTEALTYIKDAKEITNLTTAVNNEDFLEDCLKAICLLIEDGLEVTYAHRSFQEYFTAVFISELEDSEAQKELLNSYFQFAISYEMIELLYQVKSSIIDKLVIIPCIEDLERMIGFKKNLTLTNYKKFLLGCFSQTNSRLTFSRNNVLLASFDLSPMKETKGRLIAWIYKFLIEKISIDKINPAKIFYFSDNSGNQLIEIINANDKYNTQDILIPDIIKNRLILEIISKDSVNGFSMPALERVINYKNKLVSKYGQIDNARNKNLLNVLRKKSKI